MHLCLNIRDKPLATYTESISNTPRRHVRLVSPWHFCIMQQYFSVLALFIFTFRWTALKESITPMVFCPKCIAVFMLHLANSVYSRLLDIDMKWNEIQSPIFIQRQWMCNVLITLLIYRNIFPNYVRIL